MTDPTNKGEILKQEGIEAVNESNEEWHAVAIATIRRIPRGLQLTGEQIRTIVQEQCGEPRTPHAWGGLISAAAKEQLIVDTGRVGRCRIPHNRARRIVVWEIMAGAGA